MEIKNKKPKIYILAGKARTGKDTVAQIIGEICSEQKLKHINLQYSSYLKEMAQNISNWDGSEETKPRSLLQFLGTDLIRKEIDELFFIKKMCSDIKVYSKFFDVITISDARYKIEIDIIKEKFDNVYSVSMVRPNIKTTLSKTEQQHISEIDLDDYDKYDYIINNDGTLKDLEKKVQEIFNKDNKKNIKITHNEMRQMWFEFWKTKNHDIIPSASLIPINDPTLLWINAGVTPLKKFFDGSVVPNNKRMASSQKCIRTNDIENVGKTARHATFFEMLGNFSIGDYFKDEAIKWSWEFLTSNKWLGFDPKRLYITIYPTDEEAFNAWVKVGVDSNRIIKMKDNFWEIGPGPSGPCSEIFYDLGPNYDPDNLGIKMLKEDIENDRYIEIWNNVFSMYNAKDGIKRQDYEELPSKNIDTGMGLERILTILQNVDNIYETDLFYPVIEQVEKLCNKKYDGSVAFKVIADHIRTITFALSDGANFGNTGRDYVLRRLLRRAIRHGKNLNITEPFLYKLVPTVVQIMEEPFPYLKDHVKKVSNKVKKEEQLFLKTLIEGEKKLNELMDSSQSKQISGEEAFKLYDTYGFPFELTQEIALEKGYEVCKKEFDLSMEKQQERARQARLQISSMSVQNEDLINFHEKSEFVGFDKSSISTKIIGLFDGNNLVPILDKEGYIALEKTPFYAESGGQISDSGIIKINDQQLEVLEVFKAPNGQHFHFVQFEGELKTEKIVEASIDQITRENIKKNHSATHLLQYALKKVFGQDVMQAGSKVDDKTLRFDFTYDNKINDDEVIKVEKVVNDIINKKVPTKIETLPIEVALEKGAVALFENKYEDKVRVITIADSIELCGGTHVENTADINQFAIKSIESKGNNIYRIEATTDKNIESQLFDAIKAYNDGMIKLLQKSKNTIAKAKEEGIELQFNIQINHDKPLNYKDVIFNKNELEYVKKEVQSLEKRYEESKLRKAISELNTFEKNIKKYNDINTIIMSVKNYDHNILKEVINVLSNRISNSFIFIANIRNNNVNYIAKADKQLSGIINCGEIVKNASIESNGSGGGSKTYAQGGGSSIINVQKIIEEVKTIVKDIK